MSFLPSVFVLGLAALVSIGLTRGRTSVGVDRSRVHSAARALAVATGAQVVHFAEETAAGFPGQLADLLGIPEMPATLFLVFNLAWILAWLASIFALRSDRSWAFFAAYFLAIAGMVNGIAHPLLSLASSGYFAGTISAPVVGFACLWLWTRLMHGTRRRLSAL